MDFPRSNLELVSGTSKSSERARRMHEDDALFRQTIARFRQDHRLRRDTLLDVTPIDRNSSYLTGFPSKASNRLYRDYLDSIPSPQDKERIFPETTSVVLSANKHATEALVVTLDIPNDLPPRSPEDEAEISLQSYVLSTTSQVNPGSFAARVNSNIPKYVGLQRSMDTVVSLPNVSWEQREAQLMRLITRDFTSARQSIGGDFDLFILNHPHWDRRDIVESFWTKWRAVKDTVAAESYQTRSPSGRQASMSANSQRSVILPLRPRSVPSKLSNLRGETSIKPSELGGLRPNLTPAPCWTGPPNSVMSKPTPRRWISTLPGYGSEEEREHSVEERSGGSSGSEKRRYKERPRDRRGSRYRRRSGPQEGSRGVATQSGPVYSYDSGPSPSSGGYHSPTAPENGPAYESTSRDQNIVGPNARYSYPVISHNATQDDPNSVAQNEHSQVQTYRNSAYWTSLTGTPPYDPTFSSSLPDLNAHYYSATMTSAPGSSDEAEYTRDRSQSRKKKTGPMGKYALNFLLGPFKPYESREDSESEHELIDD